MQLEFQETKELLIKEREAAKKVEEQVPVVQEVKVVDHEIMNKLTAENEQLKVPSNLCCFYIRSQFMFIHLFWGSKGGY